MQKKIFLYLLSYCALFIPSAGFSLETDDFFTPQNPLTDTGSIVSELIYDRLEDARAQINQDIQKSQHSYTHWQQKHKMDRQLELLRKAMDPLKRGMLDTGIEMWLYELAKSNPNILFKPKLENTIMSGVVAPFMGNLLPYSGTINLFGYYAGMDKLGHFLALGFDYFEIIDKLVRQEKLSYPVALKSAVKWGAQTENGGFGKDASGIYSNADLAANYSGLHFYASMFHRVRFSDQIIEPLYILTDRGIELNPRSNRNKFVLIKPFVSAHWNEALNPSLFFNQPDILRKRIEAHCQYWKAFHGFYSRNEILATHQNLEHWYGHDYGHSASESGATIIRTGDICR